MKPLSIAIIGCGAVSELYYTPVLSLIQKASGVHVSLLFDPAKERASKLGMAFPSARVTNDFATAVWDEIDLAIVASPPRFHAEQTIELLRRGISVLCEKPMAATVAEADQMMAAAKRSNKLLAIGLFRRFFPVSQMIRGIIQNRSLGAAKRFEISEGGQFQWPAQSASFFQKSNSQGGVLADLGVHVLDLLIWWLGMPEHVDYEDDAMGGLEANCQLKLNFPNGVSGSVRLSRDTNLPNRTILEFERGWVRCKAAAADEFEIGFSGVPYSAGGRLVQLDTRGPTSLRTQPVATYHQSFFNQLRNVVATVRGEEPVFIPGEQGLLSLRLIEECYRLRKLMPMPWLSEVELRGAKAIIGMTQ